MKTLLLMLLIFPAFTLNSFSLAQEGDVHVELKDKLKSGDLNIDFAKLRTSGQNHLRNEGLADKVDTLKSELTKAFEEVKEDRIIELADKVLSMNYGDLRSHMFLMLVHKKVGNNDKANFHENVLAELIKSIYNANHDGSSEEKAFEVVNEDEMIIIADYMGMVPIGTVVRENDGIDYTVMVASDQAGEQEMELYFKMIE